MSLDKFDVFNKIAPKKKKSTKSKSRKRTSKRKTSKKSKSTSKKSKSTSKKSKSTSKKVKDEEKIKNIEPKIHIETDKERYIRIKGNSSIDYNLRSIHSFFYGNRIKNRPKSLETIAMYCMISKKGRKGVLTRTLELMEEAVKIFDDIEVIKNNLYVYKSINIGVDEGLDV